MNQFDNVGVYPFAANLKDFHEVIVIDSTGFDACDPSSHDDRRALRFGGGWVLTKRATPTRDEHKNNERNSPHHGSSQKKSIGMSQAGDIIPSS
jgi:hypothetical protein